MKALKTLKKYDELIESYVNGNISHVKDEVKKLTKGQRKCLFEYVNGSNALTHNISLFFYNLI